MIILNGVTSHNLRCDLRPTCWKMGRRVPCDGPVDNPCWPKRILPTFPDFRPCKPLSPGCFRENPHQRIDMKVDDAVWFQGGAIMPNKISTDSEIYHDPKGFTPDSRVRNGRVQTERK
jgi:hypothetical protein